MVSLNGYPKSAIESPRLPSTVYLRHLELLYEELQQLRREVIRLQDELRALSERKQ